MRQLFIILAVGVSLQAQTKVDLSTQSRNGSGGSGLIQFKLDNSAVGSPRATANFQSSSGLLYSLGDTGTQINIQILVDQTVLVTNNALQLGTPTFLNETSTSTSVYSWTTNPIFNTYPALGSLQAGVYTWHVGHSCLGTGITGNINTIGAVTIKRPDGSNPTTSDCAAGQNLQLTYDSSVPALFITGGLNPGGGGSSTINQPYICLAGCGASYTGNSGTTNNLVQYWAVQFPAPTVLHNVIFYGPSGTNQAWAIYSVNASTSIVGNLLATSSTGTGSGAGWYSVPFSYTVTTAGMYYIAFTANGSVNVPTSGSILNGGSAIPLPAHGTATNSAGWSGTTPNFPATLGTWLTGPGYPAAILE